MTGFARIRCNAGKPSDGWTGEMNDNMHVDDPAVAAVLAAAAAPAEGPVPGEAAALTAFRSVHHPRRRFGMPRYSEKAKLIAAAVFGGVVVISGAATAATGSLPLVSHGHQHSHPTPQNPSDNQGDDTGDDTGTTDTTDTPDTTTNDTNTNDNNGQGSSISDLAKTTAPGPDHGKTVCKMASDSKCVTQGQSAGHRQNGSDTHGNATHPNTNSLSHRQNTSHSTTPHGQSGLTHGKSSLTHGKSGQ